MRGPTKVTPPVFRETGTGWFVDGDGWVVTNGHVVQPAHETPRWLVNQQAQRAVVTACLPKALERARIVPGEKPEADDAVKRKLLDKVLPTTKVNLTPQVVVIISNGTRIKAEVKKYSPPVSTEPGAMSGRDLALLKISGDAYPVLPLTDSKVAQIGDPIHILGFPGVVSTHELLNKSASREASVTNGAVSGFKEDVSGAPMIQTDASASWGNSGGPAVDDRGAMVGRAHLRVAGARSRGRHRPGLQLHHPVAGGARLRLGHAGEGRRYGALRPGVVSPGSGPSSATTRRAPCSASRRPIASCPTCPTSSASCPRRATR